MRILFVGNYQGAEVIAQRSMRRNRHLGGSRKVELVCGIMARAGHEVVVLSGGIPAERSARMYSGFEGGLPAGGPSVARVIYSSSWDLPALNSIVSTTSALRRLEKEVSSNGPFDLLVAANIEEYTTAIAWWCHARHGAIPMILEYEDSVEATGRGTLLARSRLWRVFENWFRKRVTGVLAVNPSLADRIGHPNTIVLRGIVADSLELRASNRRPPFSSAPPYLAVFSGSLAADKGVARIIDVANAYRGLVRFVIAGTGPMEREFREMAKSRSSDVEFTGYLSQDEFDALLVSADILLNPHEDELSGGIFPFKLIEYLAAGGAVVTTRSGGKPDEAFSFCEVIAADDLSHGIANVLGNLDLARERSIRGQAWALERYSEEAVQRSVESVLQSAVGRDACAD